MIPTITIRGARNQNHAKDAIGAALQFSVMFRDREHGVSHLIRYWRRGGHWTVYWTKARGIVARWRAARR